MSIQGLTSGYSILQSLFSQSAASSTAPTATTDATTATAATALSPQDQFKNDLQALFQRRCSRAT